LSKISLTPHASGTGIFTVASPNSSTDRTLTLPDETGTVVSSGSSAVVTEAMLAAAVVPIGVGQTWTDVSSSRSLATNYTNSTGRSITFIVSISSGSSTGVGFTASVDGVVLATTLIAGITSSDVVNSTIVVQDGVVYRVDQTVGNGGITSWFELR